MRGSRWLSLALGGALACLADNGPLEVTPPDDVPPAASPEPAGPGTRWLLVYAGSRKGPATAYRMTQFRRLVTHVDSAGQPQYWGFNGAIFLHLYAPSGRVFTTWIGGTPANGADWTEYLDSLFVPSAALSRLDSSVALARATLGPPTEPFRVSVMIPYPDPNAGDLVFGGQSYDLGSVTGRSDAAAAYIRDVVRRFRAAAFAQLQLDGFYWLFEEAPESDVEVIARVADDVHAQGLRLLWIPFYSAQNWERWRELGFDAAWLQPNYFFDPTIPESRLDSAAGRAERNGMGMEIEFDGRLYADSQFSGRLAPYLATLQVQPTLRAREITVYEGAGALLRLSRSNEPRDRALYQQLGDLLR